MVGVQIWSDTDDYSRVDKRSASTENKHEATKVKMVGTKSVSTGLADALRLSALQHWPPPEIRGRLVGDLYLQGISLFRARDAPRGGMRLH